MPIKLDRALCDKSPYCPATRSCPSGALHVDRKTYRRAFDVDKCTSCGVCALSCPKGAIRER